MSEIWNWIMANYKWIFSGIGGGIILFVLGLVMARRRTKPSHNETIVTHGNRSPGKVGRDYKVETHEKKSYKIKTSGDQSPGYVAGDFKVNKTILHQSEKFKQKRWRTLDLINYPAVVDNEDRRKKYAGQLVLHLHRAFKDVGYTRFVSLLELRQKKVGKDLGPCYSLTSHQVKFTGALRKSWRYLWNPEIAPESRQRYQNYMNVDFSTLSEGWSSDIGLLFVDTPMAHQFTYDPDTRKISITPPPILSTAPSEYPDKVRTTSELLTFLSVLTRSSIAFLGDIACITSHYPLFKLMLEIVDNREWKPARIRINVENCEEWDYINTDADIEVRRYPKKNDTGRA